jgi:serine protease Do
MGKKAKFHRSTIILAIAAMIAGGLLGSYLTAQTGHSIAGAVRTVPIAIASNSEDKPTNAAALSTGFAEIAESALPAVVNISSSKIIRSSGSGPAPPFFNDPFFRDFFGDDLWPQFNVPRERREQSLGSGVIISPKGYIITNHHVVENAENIKVFLEDRRELEAEIVGTDEETDIAILKVKEENLPVLAIGDSSKVRVGDIVLAIGNPFGLGQTLTMGIVSATGRGNLGIEHYEDFIQTDAAINPGNSGGALINTRGELIGINTAIISRGSQGNQGIGFAVPIDLARHVMDQILNHGKVVRGWLGVSVQDVTPSIAKAMGLKEARGGLVGDVTPGSPASKGGIEKGDIILEVAGEQIDDKSDVALKIAQTAPDTALNIKLYRDGKERNVSITIGEREDEQRDDYRSESGRPGALSGLEVEDLTPQIARQLDLSPNTRGVVVVSVDSGSAAAGAGLRRGDVILEVNRKKVATVSEYRRAVREAAREAGERPILLLIIRDGSTVFVAVESD